jgi:HEAT repeat protein
MQCRALDQQKLRCRNDAAASAYCPTHREEMERLIGKPNPAPASLWRGMLGKLAASSNTVPDGGKYDVPKWLTNLPTPQVIEQLRVHSDSMVRWMAAFVLRKRRAPDALDALWHTRQNDPIRFVRQQAAVALGKLDTPAVYAPLVEGLHHDRDPGVREACAIALGNLGNRAAVDELMRALEYEENVFVRWDCVIALGQLGDARAEKLLVRLQAEEIAQVIRDACRDSLAEIRQRAGASASR